jgi:drug/metabolite transporter (DMT)-like permease
MSFVVGALLVVLATACWSTSGTFINLILRSSGLTPWGLAMWRDLTTFLCLLAALAIWRPALLRVRRADLPWLAVMGGVGIGLMHIMWNTSVVLNGVAVATVIQCNAPVFVTAMAWLLWREPVTWRKVIAILLSLVGTVFIGRLDNLGGIHITPLGLLLSLGSAITYGILALLAKKLTGSYGSATILMYTFGFAALVLIPFQIGGGLLVPLSLPVVGYLAGLVSLTTISGFLLYTTGLRRLPVSVASIVALTEVPFAAAVSFFTLGEQLDGRQILGAAAVVGAVVFLAWPQRGVIGVTGEQPVVTSS